MIKVNGELVSDADGMNVAEFLKTHGFPETMLAVECNGAIIPRAKWQETCLEDGAVVEVVRFVGGG